MKKFVAAALWLALSGSVFAIDTNAVGVTAGQVSRNIALSLFESVSLFEAFLYALGIFLFIKFLINASKHARYSNNNGKGDSSDYVRNFCTQLVLSCLCFAAPTVMGSMRATLFGDVQTQSVQAPQPSFN